MRFNGVVVGLFMLLAILILVATTATVMMGGNNILVKDDMSSRENVSMAVVGDVMFARNMPAVLSMESSPFAGVRPTMKTVLLMPGPSLVE